MDSAYPEFRGVGAAHSVSKIEHAKDTSRFGNGNRLSGRQFGSKGLSLMVVSSGGLYHFRGADARPVSPTSSRCAVCLLGKYEARFVITHVAHLRVYRVRAHGVRIVGP